MQRDIEGGRGKGGHVVLGVEVAAGKDEARQEGGTEIDREIKREREREASRCKSERNRARKEGAEVELTVESERREGGMKRRRKR